MAADALARAAPPVGHAWARFRRNRLAVVGLAICALLLVAAAGAPWLAPADPARQSLIEKRAKPGGKFVLGADEFGRDILSRVIYGTRVALAVGLLSVAVAMAIGLGAVAGFAGGVTDAVVMRLVEVLLAFPYLLLAIAVVSALGPGVLNTTIAVGVWGAPTVTRLVRGAVLAARQTEYVKAARAGHLVRRRARAPRAPERPADGHRVRDPVHGQRHPRRGGAVLPRAGRPKPPTPSWGLMVATGRDLLLIAPHVATIPGLAIMVAVLGFNLLGDGLRDALDPRLRGQV